MLELVPLGWFSWDFSILQNGSPIAEIKCSSWREKGTLAIGGFLPGIGVDRSNSRLGLRHRHADKKHYAAANRGAQANEHSENSPKSPHPWAFR